jgi:hypothetical protein
MQYLILIYDDEQSWAKMPEAQSQRMVADFMQYTKDIDAAGVIRGKGRLAPTRSATTIRSRGGKVTTTDGPFAETKEQLGGFYLIEVDNLDEALKWAQRCPGTTIGSIEVRPLWQPPA